MSKASLKRRLDKLERRTGGWKGIKLLLRRPEWSEDDLEREIARHNAAGEFVVVWECPPYLSEWPPEMLERYG